MKNGTPVAGRARPASLAAAALAIALAAACNSGPRSASAPGGALEVSPVPPETAQATPAAPGPSLPAGVPPDAQKATVARNVDGDTIWVEVTEPGGPLAPGALHKIRILEIDTPESTNRKDCFGAQASQFAERELPVGSTVYLAADKQDKDRYGRFLRYVWKADGQFYNEKAVAEGYAKAVLYRPNDRFIERLREAEKRARAAAAGFWAACTAQRPAADAAPSAGPGPGGPVAAPAPPASGGACDGSYPDFCIAAAPPDLDCPDIPQGNFTVSGADPHRFDSDRDGRGCEV